jgi:CRISPR/Cas system-associated endonuclease Cas1
VVVASVHVVLSASPSSPVGINTVTKRIKQVLHRFVHELLASVWSILLQSKILNFEQMVASC